MLKPEDKHKALTDRAVKWGKRIGVEPANVRVRHMSRKWASCSTRGMLTLGWEVADLPSKLADYVIVHELLHLRVPNHGKLWKSFMRAYLGDYEKLEEKLNGY